MRQEHGPFLATPPVYTDVPFHNFEVELVTVQCLRPCSAAPNFLGLHLYLCVSTLALLILDALGKPFSMGWAFAAFPLLAHPLLLPTQPSFPPMVN